MTDVERLRALLNDFGIPFTEENGVQTPNGIVSEIRIGPGRNDNPYELAKPPVDGYAGFFTLFEFDASGKFKGMGVWE